MMVQKDMGKWGLDLRTPIVSAAVESDRVAMLGEQAGEVAALR